MHRRGYIVDQTTRKRRQVAGKEQTYKINAELNDGKVERDEIIMEKNDGVEKDEIEGICSMADRAIRTLDHLNIVFPRKRKDLDIREVQIHTTATLCSKIIDHYKAIRALVSQGHLCSSAILLRTIMEAWIKFEGWADGKRDVREYVDKVAILHYYELKDALAFYSHGPIASITINQEITSYSDFFDNNVPARHDIVDNWDVIMEDAFDDDDAIKNNVHKRMKRLTLTYWSIYTHMGLYPDPDPNTVLNHVDITVALMLRRAMQFCLEKDLLHDKGGRAYAQEALDRCELYINRKQRDLEIARADLQ